MTIASSKEGAPGSGARRWLWPLLVVSLSLNLLIAGFALGGAWLHRHKPAGVGMKPAGAVAGPIGRIVARLPAERLAALKDLVRQHHDVASAGAVGVVAARKEVAGALEADPFDRPKLETALKHLNDAQQSAHGNAIQAAGALIEQLSPTERRDLIREMRWQDQGGAEGK